MSVFLVYMGWPRLHAALLYLPVDTAIARYYETREAPSAVQLRGLQERAAQSFATSPHSRYLDGLSLLHFLRAVDTGQSLYQRRQDFEAAIEAAEGSLRRAPAQPRTWLRIAQARSWLRYPPEQVIAALKMSVYTGRVEPSMFMTRLSLGLAYLTRMDAEGRSMMRDQVLLAWRFQPRAVVRGLRGNTLKLRHIEELLDGAHDPVLLEMRESAGDAVR